MNFTLDLSEVKLEVCRTENESIIRVKLGDDGGFLDYFLTVGFSPVPPAGDLEFFFKIDIVDNELNYIDPVFESSRVSLLFSKDEKKLIRNALFGAAGEIIKRTEPKIFYVRTYTAYLPENALKKFHMLNHIFVSHGYNVRSHDPYHGCYLWVMERRE